MGFYLSVALHFNPPYENILGPMIIAKSNSNENVFGIVSAVLGMGGIICGIFVSIGKLPKNKVKAIFFPAIISFLLGDWLMAIGQTWWVHLPFVTATQRVIMYHKAPIEIQGRVFGIRNAIQYCTIAVGILLGGFLVDYVFEPFMQSNNTLAVFFIKLLEILQEVEWQ